MPEQRNSTDARDFVAPLRPRRPAYTLIELLTVIAIFGVLVLILLPSLKHSMTLASSTVCRHHLRELGHGIQMYRIDNAGWLPTSDRPGSVSGDAASATPWFVKLEQGYLEDLSVMTCPSDPVRMAPRVTGGADGRQWAGSPSYGISSFILTAGGGYLADADRFQSSRPLDTILLGDLGPDASVVSSVQAVVQARTATMAMMSWDDGAEPLSFQKSPYPWLTDRHSRGINMLTLGGQVREAVTQRTMRSAVGNYYDSCAAGGCTLCNDLRISHYSFARDHLFWWTGPVPAE